MWKLYFKDLHQGMRDRISTVEYINHAGQDLLGKAPTDDEKSRKLNKDLEVLNNRWSHMQSVISVQIGNYEEAMEKLKQFKVPFNNASTIYYMSYLN